MEFRQLGIAAAVTVLVLQCKQLVQGPLLCVGQFIRCPDPRGQSQAEWVADLEVVRIPAAQDLQEAMEVQGARILVEVVVVQVAPVPPVVPVQQAVQDLPEVMDQKAVQVPAPAVDQARVEAVPVADQAPAAGVPAEGAPMAVAPMAVAPMEVVPAEDRVVKTLPLQAEVMDRAVKIHLYRIVVTAAVRAIRTTALCVESQMCSVSSKTESAMW